MASKSEAFAPFHWTSGNAFQNTRRCALLVLLLMGHARQQHANLLVEPFKLQGILMVGPILSQLVEQEVALGNKRVQFIRRGYHRVDGQLVGGLGARRWSLHRLEPASPSSAGPGCWKQDRQSVVQSRQQEPFRADSDLIPNLAIQVPMPAVATPCAVIPAAFQPNPAAGSVIPATLQANPAAGSVIPATRHPNPGQFRACPAVHGANPASAAPASAAGTANAASHPRTSAAESTTSETNGLLPRSGRTQPRRVGVRSPQQSGRCAPSRAWRCGFAMRSHVRLAEPQRKMGFVQAKWQGQ